ncbi:hypothetical protein JCGZ_19218 [Jatropha curcas]|uniref:Uncharacterized protein n=1 Tax=Jatropha curcas TaxID=180498 RepID=A0A067L7C4_JATCU|nr:hypothetical protein JCGZ_19218 [Jatropha curcas]
MGSPSDEEMPTLAKLSEDEIIEANKIEGAKQGIGRRTSEYLMCLQTLVRVSSLPFLQKMASKKSKSSKLAKVAEAMKKKKAAAESLGKEVPLMVLDTPLASVDQTTEARWPKVDWSWVDDIYPNEANEEDKGGEEAEGDDDPSKESLSPRSKGDADVHAISSEGRDDDVA